MNPTTHLKAYAVTLALSDMGKLIYMMFSLKKRHKIMLGSIQRGVLPKCCKISKENPQEVPLEKTPPSYLHLQAVIHLEPGCCSCREFSGKAEFKNCLQSKWDQAANTQDLRSSIFFQETIITQTGSIWSCFVTILHLRKSSALLQGAYKEIFKKWCHR